MAAVEHPVFIFSEPLDLLGDLFSTVDFTQYEVHGERLSDAIPEISATYDTDPDAALAKLKTFMDDLLTLESLDTVLKTWPPAIDKCSKPAVLFILAIVIRSSKPHDMLRAICETVCPDFIPTDKSVLSVVTVKTKQGQTGWLTVMDSKTFEYSIDGIVRESGTVASFDCDDRGRLKFFDETGKVSGTWLLDTEQKALWMEKRFPLFPMTLTSCDGSVPDVVIHALYEWITADDMMFLMSIPYMATERDPNEGKRIARALLDVFIHAGKVNQMLVALIGCDFDGEKLDHGEVLRTDSMFTNMIKVFYSRYAEDFYEKTLNKITEFIDSTGDVGLSRPASCDSERVKNILVTVLNCLLLSQEHVSPQVHHMASIVKMVAAARFNDEGAVYNALSGTFYLRLIGVAITNPKTDKTRDLQQAARSLLMKVRIPFSSLMQSVLNRKPLRNADSLKDLNLLLEEYFYPELLQYTRALAVPPETPPVYEVPSPEKLRERLLFILSWVTKTQVEFRKNFAELVTRSSKRHHPVYWSLQCFLMSYFKEKFECEK